MIKAMGGNLAPVGSELIQLFPAERRSLSYNGEIYCKEGFDIQGFQYLLIGAVNASIPVINGNENILAAVYPPIDDVRERYEAITSIFKIPDLISEFTKGKIILRPLPIDKAVVSQQMNHIHGI